MVNIKVKMNRAVCFFLSSRRRHTRSLCDWSSDVCSSDLPPAVQTQSRGQGAREWKPGDGRAGWERRWRAMEVSFRVGASSRTHSDARVGRPEQRSEERRVGKSVDLGGRRIIKKKKKRER